MISYHSLLEDILANGEHHDDRTGVGTLSVFGRQWRHDMREGFPLITTKYVPFRWVAEELFWFLSGSTNERDLAAKGVDIWKEWADENGELGPVYGKQWRDFGGVDQIATLEQYICDNPNSRRLLVSAWNPVEVRAMALPPCHTMFQIKCTEERRMSLHLYMRSCDAFLGLPFNIASYALLLELLARTNRYVTHELIISFGDLHIYKNHLLQVRTQLSREPRRLPQLWTNYKSSVLRYEYEDLKLFDYDPHPAIKAEVAV